MFAPPAHHLMCWKAWGQSFGITATPDGRCNQESAVIESILSIPDISRTECCCPSHLVGGYRDLFKSMCTAGVMRLVEGAAILLHHTCWCVGVFLCHGSLPVKNDDRMGSVRMIILSAKFTHFRSETLSYSTISAVWFTSGDVSWYDRAQQIQPCHWTKAAVVRDNWFSGVSTVEE